MTVTGICWSSGLLFIFKGFIMPSCLTLSGMRDYVEDEFGVCLPMTTLYSLIENGRGPASFKVGRRIFIRRSDIDDWVESQMMATARGGEQ